jgi:O-succinylbenzoic acid--CoA ligase
VGINDEEWGERIGAVLVPDDPVEIVDTAALTDRVKANCRAKLAGYKIPRELCVVDSLPRTQSGTVEREPLQELLTDPE